MYRHKDRRPVWLEPSSPGLADVSLSSLEFGVADDTSLSLTRHLPDDIEDECVDSLVAEAERILHANDTLSDGTSDNDEPPPLPVKRTVKPSSHQALAAVDVVDYKPDEISLDSLHNSDDRDMNNSDLHISDLDEDSDASEGGYTMPRFDPSRGWCGGLRSLDVDVPEEMTDDWLSSLPLVTVADDYLPSVAGVISELQEKMECGDPHDEFRQLRDVPLSDYCEMACEPCNRYKNRFRNVLPCTCTSYVASYVCVLKI